MSQYVKLTLEIDLDKDIRKDITDWLKDRSEGKGGVLPPELKGYDRTHQFFPTKYNKNEEGSFVKFDMEVNYGYDDIIALLHLLSGHTESGGFVGTIQDENDDYPTLIHSDYVDCISGHGTFTLSKYDDEGNLVAKFKLESGTTTNLMKKEELEEKEFNEDLILTSPQSLILSSITLDDDSLLKAHNKACKAVI